MTKTNKNTVILTRVVCDPLMEECGVQSLMYLRQEGPADFTRWPHTAHFDLKWVGPVKLPVSVKKSHI